MAYEVCNICGSMFEKDGNKYCKPCYDENKREYELVLDYITRYPNHTVLDITTETKVSIKSIDRFVKDGSISYINKEDS